VQQERIILSVRSVSEGGEDYLGERHGDECCDGKKEEFPIKRDDEHAKAVGKKAECHKPYT